MRLLTSYLSATLVSPGKYSIRVSTGGVFSVLKDSLLGPGSMRYSPIQPAFIRPGETQPTLPQPRSASFYFASRPHHALGRLKLELSAEESDRAYFSQGLASIVILDVDIERSRELLGLFPTTDFEYWPIENGHVEAKAIVAERQIQPSTDRFSIRVEPTGTTELDVYVEQIVSSLATLWHFYAIHAPSELVTINRVWQFAERLIKHHQEQSLANSWAAAERQNAIISALVELSAALSYSVTQGTSGVSPILANPSPFPHHSLLGVGFAVRALTKFTRYMEAAFGQRSAADVIKRSFCLRKISLKRLSTYDSGVHHKAKPLTSIEDFDEGGEFPESVAVPLLAQFSLRHGFKESKFSVTAASESLTAGTLPQWTLMTLSHEIMHSRVRDIFQALFGTSWRDATPFDHWEQYYREFSQWYEANDPAAEIPMDQAFRNAVLMFCLAAGRLERSDARDILDGPQEVFEEYRRHKMLAVELFVHFHDYYFVYACQQRLYAMGIWASWTKVAAPYLRPLEYLIRTLATIATGTGLAPRPAFISAIEQFEDTLLMLESKGVSSPLFDKIREYMKGKERERTFGRFKAAYYLLDHVRRGFSSRTISSKIDRIEQDPFAEGSSDAGDYSASIYAYGGTDDSEFVSPVRFCLSSLVLELEGASPKYDPQWLTAWHSIVIGSQEEQQ